VEFDEDDPEAEAEAAEAKVGGSFPWSGSDRDYTYEELVGECVWGGGGWGGCGGGSMRGAAAAAAAAACLAEPNWAVSEAAGGPGGNGRGGGWELVRQQQSWGKEGEHLAGEAGWASSRVGKVRDRGGIKVACKGPLVSEGAAAVAPAGARAWLEEVVGGCGPRVMG
jgi:hypothetical protein